MKQGVLKYMCSDVVNFGSREEGGDLMSDYSVPKKSPYVVKIKNGETLSTNLLKTTPRQKKAIETSAKKFEARNIRKGW